MTFTVRELREDELEKVSGGLKADSNEVAVEGLVGRAFGVAGGNTGQIVTDNKGTLLRDYATRSIAKADHNGCFCLAPDGDQSACPR